MTSPAASPVPPDETPAADPDGRTCGGDPRPRRWAVLAVVGAAVLMIAVDQTVVATALGSIQADLDADLNWTVWTITVYALGQLVSMPVAGRLGDQYGRRRTFLAGVSIFVVASACCGLSGNIFVLIGFRFLQALGGGALMPSATGLVADYFGRDRDRGVGMISSILPIGAVIGPIIGGLIVSWTSWRVIFLVNLPIGVSLLFLGWWLMADSRRPVASRVDLSGIALLAALLLSAMLGVTGLGIGVGVTDPRFVLAELVALGCLALFLRHARRHPHPIVPLRLLLGRGFGRMNLVNLLLGAVALGFTGLLPLYAQLRYGAGPLAAGSALTFRAIGIVCMAGLSVLLMRRIGQRVLLITGFLLLGIGSLLMAAPPPGVPGFGWLAVGGAVSGIGLGVAIPASNNAVLQLAPGHISAITGLRGMFRQTGGIVTVSVATALLSLSAAPVATFAMVFVGFAGLLLAAVLLVIRLPDHRGRW